MQLSTVSRLKHENFVELIGYCLESNNRILVYQYASLGSLHDILHGMSCFINIYIHVSFIINLVDMGIGITIFFFPFFFFVIFC